MDDRADCKNRRLKESKVNPKICLFSSAHRPQNWMNLYRSIGDNDVEFELVFVGPNKPSYGLPKNFRFIRTDVKPAQCVEIAVRNTAADLIMNIADDCEFATPRPLDKLYDLYRSCNSDKAIVSSRYMENGIDMSHSAHHFFAHDESTPVIDLCGLMSRRLFCDIGGVDKNFIAIMWPLDITMRIHALGGGVVMSDVYINEAKGRSAGSNLCAEFWKHDRLFLEKLWTTDGKVHLNRKSPVESFSDADILEASQGPRGRWRGSRPLLYEKIEDNLPRVMRGISKPHMYLNYANRIIAKAVSRIGGA
jgi:GT2 family glycosyltransferase